MTWPAASYDAWFEQRWGRYAFSVETTAVLGALGPVGAGRVLDCGCGTGRFLVPLVDRGGSPIGIDRDRGMLEVASRAGGAPLVRGDAQALPLSTGSMDAAVAVALLEFVADPPAAVAEMCRVTRPGGRVVIGALNPQSLWGAAHRRSLRRPPWTAARFLTHRQLRALADPHGPATLRAVLYAPGPVPGLDRLGPLVERVGRRVPALGAFRVLTIHRR